MNRQTLPTHAWLGLLAALAATRPTEARPTEARQTDRYSIVAQSTDETAGTGRRPIGRRIRDSNLPMRSTSAPAAVDSASAADGADSGEPVVEAEPVAPPADDALATSPGMSETEATVTPEQAAAASAPHAGIADEPGPHDSAGTRAPPTGTTVDDQPESTAGIEQTVMRAPKTHAQPGPRPLPVERETLLQRIRTSLGNDSSKRPSPAGERSQAAEAHGESSEELFEAEQCPSPTDEPGLPSSAELARMAPAPIGGDPSDPLSEPARLEFDVRESRPVVGEGEQIVMRIAVRNIGGETAERVTATLFFAEGIEPLQAIGHTAEIYPGEVRFQTVDELPPGESVDLLVTAVGTHPGHVLFRGELDCRQPSGRVAREGAVTVRSRGPAKR